nr:hypothetical protein [Tanacetum cinerariifolium]
LLRDDSQGEAFPTVSSLDAGHDRENIIKTSALPHVSLPRVTSLDADEGSMQQPLQELMDLCTSLQREEPAQEDAPIKGGSIEIMEEVRVERSTELGKELIPSASFSLRCLLSDDSEMVLGVGLAGMLDSMLLKSASTPMVSSNLLDKVKALSK